MKKEWKAIEGFEGLYEVSNHGEVKSLERFVENNGGLQKKHEKLLKKTRRKSTGHCMVVLCKEGKTYPKLVHRLVAQAFIPNPENKPVVDHIDTNTANNRADNLRWVTVKENANNPLTRKHISQSKMGHVQYVPSEVSRNNIKKAHEANRGKKLSEQHKRKLSDAHQNSEIALASSIKNIKKAQLVNTGKHLADETKAKLSISHKGIHKGMTWKVIDGKRIWLERKDE